MCVIELTQLMKDYQWMKREADRLRISVYGIPLPNTKWGQTYGIESTMPQGSSIQGVDEMEAMDVRELKQIDRMKRYERNVLALERAVDVLSTEQQKTIYDCLLDDMTYRQIAEHLAVSRDYIQKQKTEIVRQIGQNRQTTALLQDR